MEAIRDYALSVFCAALVVSILIDLSGKSSFHKQLRLVAGIFFAVILLRPLLHLTVPELSLSKSFFSQEAEQAASLGEKSYIRSLCELIRGESEAYILKEAAALGAELEVEVELDMGDPPAPWAVKLRGCFEAEQEQALSKLLSEQFGIPKERQTWMRVPSQNSGSS